MAEGAEEERTMKTNWKKRLKELLRKQRDAYRKGDRYEWLRIENIITANKKAPAATEARPKGA